MSTAILIASYGGQIQQGRETGLALFQKDLERKTGLFTVQAFYNKRLVRKKPSLSLQEQMKRLLEYSPEKLIVIPTFLVPGKTWNGFRTEISACRDMFPEMEIRSPFLEKEANRSALAHVLAKEFSLTADTACLCIGHGSGDASDLLYREMEKALQALGLCRLYFALLHGMPGPEDYLDFAKTGWKKGSCVTVIPFLTGSGRHLTEDIAGDMPGTVSALLEGAGYQAKICRKGLLEISSVREMWVDKHGGLSII